ncbi:DUF4168 domain-containing protein [Desulfoplanes sp. PS50]
MPDDEPKQSWRKRLMIKNCTQTGFLLHTAFVMIVGLLFFAAPALAQEGQQKYPAGMEAQQPELQDFDDQTVDNFASSMIEVQTIRNQFTQKLQGVQDQERAVALQQEMSTKMIDAVQNQGLDVETFNTIASQMTVDQQLQKKVEGLIEQKMQ